MVSRLGVAVILLAAVVAPVPSVQAHGDDDFEIVTLSNRADLISGGDALIEVRVPRGVSLSKVELKLNGERVGGFEADSRKRTLRGLLTGLVQGRNDFIAKIDERGKHRDRFEHLVITNHPIGGPVLSGPQVTPFFCATAVPQGATASSPATNWSGLSDTSPDAQCNMDTEYKLYYRTTAAATTCSFDLPDATPGVNFLNPAPPTVVPPRNPAAPPLCFKPYDPAAPRPADIAQTTTDEGHTVDYIVRVERGTMNRGIFDIAVLFNPSQPWSATAPQAQWNGKVFYQFGASTGQPRRQFRPAPAWTNELALSRGYLVAQNSMTDSATNSNRVMMTETVMMMKEHIGDRYGPVKFTMGSGCSGGSINSNMNASIAPGQLDGIVISCAYPDSETTAIEVSDCVLLVEAYQKPAWTALMTGKTPEEINAKKAAINGHPDQSGCHGWYTAFGNNGKAGNHVPLGVLNHATGAVTPIGGQTNNCQLPFGMVYPNPNGARCSAWDWAVPIWGSVPNEATADPLDSRARDTRDNTGIQYGLKALMSGAITADEFVTLNELVGGVSHDGLPQAARSVADAEALEIAYRAGIVMSGRQLAKTPVIDLRGWDDSGIIRPSLIPIHYVWRSFSIRERLDRQFGDHGNQVMWRFGTGLGPSAALTIEAFNTMDAWLTELVSDDSHRPIERKVRRAKPDSAFDFCLLTSDPTQSVKVTDPAVCNTDPFLRPHSSPRQVAGGPLTEDVLKCRLKPLSSADYAPLVFTPAQWSRLQEVFPDGVCDWNRRGVGQQSAHSPRDYSDGPGGERLRHAPDSHLHR
jgi:hypothetical protein